VSAVLGNYFVDFPLVRSYIVDETGAVRRHVVIFVDGKQLLDVVGLSDPVDDASEIYVMQALSGG
jgi:sulfur-carrier protein